MVGGVIRHPRLYDVSVAAGFLGQRARVYDELVRHSQARQGDRVLDLGTGTGYLLQRAALVVGPGGHVTGIDPGAEMVRVACRRVPENSDVQIARAEDLPFGDATFDLVISTLAFHHIPRAGRPLALAEAHRVLTPGGRLFLADLRPPRSTLGKALGRVLTGHGAEEYPLDEALVTAAGFELIARGESWPMLRYLLARRS
jgi:ubiquinone/menaquinone biosynthesis C-methylase UbiE